METKKSTISILAASQEEIQEASPVPSDLDILPPSHTDPFDPVVPAVPPGYDVPPGFNMEVPIAATPISFGIGRKNKSGQVRKGKTPVSDVPVPSDLDIKPPSHTDPFDPVVPAVPPGYDVPPGFNMEVPIAATPISFAIGGKNKSGRVRKGKTPVSDVPVPSDLDIKPPSHTDPFDPVVPAAPPGFNMEVPIAATPISFAIGGQNKSGRVRKGKTPVSNEITATKKAKQMVRSLRGDLARLASSSNAMTQPRAHADAILATFDALRRRLEQTSKADGVKDRPDMKAQMIMIANGLMANTTMRFGSVPGIEVGDIFYFRMEMRVVGLHSLPVAGIDYMEDDTNQMAIAIVSSGGYENKDDDVDKMVYTGHGGNGKKVEQKGDQKLEQGNYAMEQSKIGGNLIRVIRSRNDPFIRGNKVYIYDGLYKIKKSMTKNSKLGFKIFKFKLVREQGQPNGFAIWKMTEKWKENPDSRGKVLTLDLSSGKESIPVTVINEVDDEPKPNNFSYFTTIAHGQNLRAKDQVPAGCQCKKLCIPNGAADCYCASENGGWLPYNPSGLLTKRLPLLYECGSGCVCRVKCQNRVTQRGVKLHFEVFRTQNRGWGLRSWDPIRAGSFVCEFVGKHLENPCSDSKELVMNEYVFCATHPGEKALKWNLGMELATKGEEMRYEPEQVPVPMINSKDTGNVSRFINHSCDPNLFWQLVRYGCGDGQCTHVMLFATKHIPPMTELTYDYSGNTEGNGGRRVGAKQCLCGAANCRGHLG